MIKYKNVTKTILETEDVICNKCGESCKDKENMNYEGLIEVSVLGGFCSKYIGDDTEYVFSLCEKCTMDLIKSFSIPAKING